MFGFFSSPDLARRAKLAAEQMIFFSAISKKVSFGELSASASRAGFIVDNEDEFRKEAGFHWAEGTPDFSFYISYADPRAISVIAESYGEIFGLVMVSHSHLPNISVETKEDFGVTMGKSAIRFRNMLLGFPGFDKGSEDFFRLFQ